MIGCEGERERERERERESECVCIAMAYIHHQYCLHHFLGNYIHLINTVVKTK